MGTPESFRFYDRLFNLLDLNQALTLAGYCPKYVCDMDEHEYQEYMYMLEYLHMKGIIDLDMI